MPRGLVILEQPIRYSIGSSVHRSFETRFRRRSPWIRAPLEVWRLYYHRCRASIFSLQPVLSRWASQEWCHRRSRQRTKPHLESRKSGQATTRFVVYSDLAKVAISFVHLSRILLSLCHCHGLVNSTRTQTLFSVESRLMKTPPRIEYCTRTACELLVYSSQHHRVSVCIPRNPQEHACVLIHPDSPHY